MSTGGGRGRGRGGLGSTPARPGRQHSTPLLLLPGMAPLVHHGPPSSHSLSSSSPSSQDSPERHPHARNGPESSHSLSSSSPSSSASQLSPLLAPRFRDLEVTPASIILPFQIAGKFIAVHQPTTMRSARGSKPGAATAQQAVHPPSQAASKPPPIQPTAMKPAWGSKPVAATIQQAPVQQAPVQQAPAQQAPIQQAIQQAPVQQAPVQQAPVQQVPVQRAPIWQARVQQAPVQQAPIQQAPVQTTRPPTHPPPAPVQQPSVQPPVAAAGGACVRATPVTMSNAGTLKGPQNYHGKQQPPKRPGFGTQGRKMVVQANFFPIKLPQQITLYHYDVAMVPEKMPKNHCRKVGSWCAVHCALSKEHKE